MLKSLPPNELVDVNRAPVEQIKAALHVDDEKANAIIAGRPYRNWAEFSYRHPEFSAPNLEALKQSGVIIGATDLNRLTP
jgi:hypothetical protein